nr:PREDICTED: elongation of very long chain fatty acids protein 4-like [Bemisia tabaci]
MTQLQRGSWIQEKLDILKSEFIEDDVVDNWFLMSSTWPIVTIIGVYLFFCLKWGPKYMEDKKPFEMKWILLAYNLFQVILNGNLVWQLFTTPGSMSYVSNHVCNPLGKNNPLFMSVCSGSWNYLMLKVTDLLATVFFVLRKKQSQISFLHVYHHTQMVFIAWAYLKYLKGEHFVLIGALNAFVHVVMYSYYFLAALGPSVQKYLFWKRYITKLQIVQFLMVLAYFCALIWFRCGIQRSLAIYCGLNVFFFLILFLNFYSNAYNKKRGVRAGRKKSH